MPPTVKEILQAVAVVFILGVKPEQQDPYDLFMENVPHI